MTSTRGLVTLLGLFTPSAGAAQADQCPGSLDIPTTQEGRDAGYGDPGDGWRAGENLGWGTGSRATPASLVNEWLASPAHKRNMLREPFREIGVGVAGGAPQQTDGLPGATYALNLGVIRSG